MAGSTVVLGVIVSGLVEYIKREFDFTETGSLVLVAFLSIAGAGIYEIAELYGFLPALQEVLTTAGAFYAFIIKRFDK